MTRRLADAQRPPPRLASSVSAESGHRAARWGLLYRMLFPALARAKPIGGRTASFAVHLQFSACPLERLASSWEAIGGKPPLISGPSASLPADGMDYNPGFCQPPSELFILELCDVEGPDECFVVCFQLLDRFSVLLPQPF